MEIKPTDNLGASFLGRVGEQRVGGIFNSSDRENFEKADLRNRALKAFADRGIKTLDKAIDYKLEEEMIKGSTDALAGIAEEEMETNILTKNFRIAGHRNMSASLKHQQWQAGVLDSISKGEFNDLNPEEFGKKLNESIDSIMPDVRGMSAQARKSMLETILTGNQTLIAQQMKSRTESIISAKMGDYSLQANNLLTEATLNKGTNLETATVQQVQALVRKIHTDENLPTEVKNKLIEELQTGSAKMGLVAVSQGILNAPIPYGEEGQVVPYGSTMSVKSFTAGNVAVNDSIKENVWEYNEEGRKTFLDFKSKLEKGKYQGTQDEVIGHIRNGLFSKSITNAEATRLYSIYSDQQYVQNNSAQIRNAWKDNNVPEMLRLGSNDTEGREQYVQWMQSKGMSLAEQATSMTSVFASNNGRTSAVRWIGEELLKPILNEVINSEGGVLTENVELFNVIMAQADGFNNTRTQGLYLNELYTSLDIKQADFIEQYIAQRKAGSDEETARDFARAVYANNSKASELDRSQAVQRNSKIITELTSDLSNPSFYSNLFFASDIVSNLFGVDSATIEKKVNTPSFFRPERDAQVDARSVAVNRIAETLAKEYARANPTSFSKSSASKHILSELNNRIKGSGEHVVIFTNENGFQRMFPNTSHMLFKQQDEVVEYVLSNLDLDSLTGNTLMNGSFKSYEFSGDVLTVKAHLKDGQSYSTTVRPEQYEGLVEQYETEKYGRSTPKGFEKVINDRVNVLDFNRVGFDASFKYTGYNNILQDYSPNFIEQLYLDNLPLEGWRLDLYADDLRGGNRKSIGMGVNSGNKWTIDKNGVKHRNEYTEYFEKAEKGDLTKQEAEELTQLAVKSHLRNASSMISKELGKDYVGVSDDLDLAMFKLSYAQWKGEPNSTKAILQGVAENDFEKVLEGVHSSYFFRDTAGGSTENPQYKYLIMKLAGAMNELQNRGIGR